MSQPRIRVPALFALLVVVGALPPSALAQIHPAPADPPADHPPAADRSGTLVDAIHRSGAVPRCWNAFIQQEPNAPSVHFRLRVEVATDGAVRSVALLDPTPEPLAQCVRTQVRHLTLPSGDAITVEAGYAFAPGVPAPVPITR